MIQNSISKKIENEILKKIQKLAYNLDVIIFSDFNYGCISDDLILKVSKVAKKKVYSYLQIVNHPLKLETFLDLKIWI